MFPLQHRGDLGKALSLVAAKGRVQNHRMGLCRWQHSLTRGIVLPLNAGQRLNLVVFERILALCRIKPPKGLEFFRMWFMVLIYLHKKEMEKMINKSTTKYS